MLQRHALNACRNIQPAPPSGLTQTDSRVLRREELQEYDAFDEGVFCRSRTWLFLSYVVSFGAVAGSVWVLMQVRAPLSPLERFLRVTRGDRAGCKPLAAASGATQHGRPRLLRWNRAHACPVGPAFGAAAAVVCCHRRRVCLSAANKL